MIYQILLDARIAYEVPAAFVEELGPVRYPGSEEVRRLELRMRLQRSGPPSGAAGAGGLLAMGVLNEAQRLLLGLFRDSLPLDPLLEATTELARAAGAESLDGCLRSFTRLFPPREPIPSIVESRRQDLLGEVLLLSLVNRNPACRGYEELFSDTLLRRESVYDALVAGLESWSAAAGPALGWSRGIVDMLMAPVRHAPDSLLAQLEYIREHWGRILGSLLDRLLLALDVLREESRMRIGGAPGGPQPLPAYTSLEHEVERYSADLQWMPRLVLIAKHALVWLDQLSRRHGRRIDKLDAIPDEEIDALAEAGFTGLWLIGIWKRSPASRNIKRRCGNPEAAGSAYSITEYVVEPALGGEGAARALGERLWSRGIRLAADMVPNHTAMDSRWVVEHPEWFIQSPTPPFPSYRFDGPDLSEDSRVALHLEDHYYDRTDAAVVFKRTDRSSGESRYIYHGNDGTATPWNDTAQIDFLKPEVREAVIGQIVSVARSFPIIRFDAAMVLTRKHFQRLWYPPPGSGGDIPSRAERGLPAEEFARRMGGEFWREVVDRLAVEAPGTLLLAEAFWLLEGYFVRTLGMHRVYNSAFMNMLKTEDNARYRQLIKSTLEFDPEILKRYVNFMSNPDEEPAAVQFGTGDKYFGIALMMVTLPGLPMFGHGQIEGDPEKHGMEYAKSYRDSEPDLELIERHRREIFPLLKLRSLFAEVHSFRLYDLYTSSGAVNENVFAYSNRRDTAFALVVYNNRFEHAAGWISLSAAYRDKARGGNLERSSIADEIGLSSEPDCYCLFHDLVSRLEFVRSSRTLREQGLHVSLGAFRSHVFTDFREVRDNRLGHYSRLAADLGGAGVPSIEESLRGYLLPAHAAIRSFVSSPLAHELLGEPSTAVAAPARIARALEGPAGELSRSILAAYGLGASGAPPPAAPTPPAAAGTTASTPRLPARAPAPRAGPPAQGRPPAALRAYLEGHPWLSVLLILRESLRPAERALGDRFPGTPPCAALLDELRLADAVRLALHEHGIAEAEASRAASLLSIALLESDKLRGSVERGDMAVESFLGQASIRAFLAVNWFDGKEWFRREPFEDLLWLLCAQACWVRPPPASAKAEAGARAADTLARHVELAQSCGYRVDRYLEEAVRLTPGGPALASSPPARAGKATRQGSRPKRSTRRR